MIGTVAMAVSIAVMAPIVGTGIALAVLVALRAASITGRQVARRRAADGGRAAPGSSRSPTTRSRPFARPSG